MGRARIALALTALGLLAGCARDGRVATLERWEHDGAPITLPAHVPPDPERRAIVLETDLVLPATMAAPDTPLVLAFAELLAPAELRVDGELAVSLDAQAGYRHVGPARFELPARALADGRAHLRLRISDTWSQARWIDTVPVVIPADATAPSLARSTFFHGPMAIVGLVALLEIALTCLFVFLLDRSRWPYLWFGLQALAASVYCLFVAGGLHPLVGHYDVRVVGTGLVGAFVVSVYFTRTYFELTPPSRGWLAAFLLATAIIVVCGGPHEGTEIAGPIVVALGAVVIAYQIATCAGLVARHHDRVSAVLHLGSWLALATTSWVDFARWAGVAADFGGVRAAPLGLTIFSLSLALLLSRNHLLSLRRSDRLNAELTARVTELEVHAREIRALNDELRRQIGERSEQLVSALSLGADARRIPNLAIGDVVQGRYRIEREIATGGMGTVWEVSRIADGRRFALKRTLEGEGPALARLAREASIASRVDHPNVVRIVDVDIASDGFLFLVMELAPGSTLRAMADSYGDKPFALAVLAQTAEGLAALHEAGVVHRDLKPANILVDASQRPPRVWITDFGISRLRAEETTRARPRTALNDDDITADLVESAPTRTPSHERHAKSLTETGHLPGTPLYMAPELARGAEVGPPADLFALGIVARELLVKQRPFLESVALTMLEGESFPTITPIATLWPDAPPELARLLDACLAESAAERPTARDLADALARAARA